MDFILVSPTVLDSLVVLFLLLLVPSLWFGGIEEWEVVLGLGMRGTLTSIAKSSSFSMFIISSAFVVDLTMFPVA